MILLLFSGEPVWLCLPIIIRHCFAFHDNANHYTFVFNKKIIVLPEPQFS